MRGRCKAFSLQETAVIVVAVVVVLIVVDITAAFPFLPLLFLLRESLVQSRQPP